MRYCKFDRPIKLENGSSAIPSHKGAVFALLRHRVNGKLLLVCSLHLSVPKNTLGDLDTEKQVGEVSQLFAKIHDIRRRTRLSHFNARIPVVVAGDCNTIPVGRLISQNVAQPDAYQRLISNHTCPLYSSYAAVRPNGSDPDYTSISPSFAQCIDYIFYSLNESILPIRVIDIVASPLHLWKTPILSDHLPLTTQFAFVQ